MNEQNKMMFPTDIWTIIKSYMLDSNEDHLDKFFETRLIQYLKSKSTSFKILVNASCDLLDEVGEGLYNAEITNIKKISKNTKISVVNRKSIIIKEVCETMSYVNYSHISFSVSRYSYKGFPPAKIRPFMYLYNINDILWINKMKCIVVNKSWDYVEIAEFDYRETFENYYEVKNGEIVNDIEVRRWVWTFPSNKIIRHYYYIDNYILSPKRRAYSMRIDGFNRKTNVFENIYLYH